MNPQEFLIKHAEQRLSAKKFKGLTMAQRERAIEFCLNSWRKTDHRAEDALRKMESMAKKL